MYWQESHYIYNNSLLKEIRVQILINIKPNICKNKIKIFNCLPWSLRFQILNVPFGLVHTLFDQNFDVIRRSIKTIHIYKIQKCQGSQQTVWVVLVIFRCQPGFNSGTDTASNGQKRQNHRSPLVEPSRRSYSRRLLFGRFTF